MDLKDKIALVTGGASGIGLCYVKELLKNGIQHVTIADIIQDKEGQAVVKSLNTQYGKGRVLFIKCDVANAAELENAFKTTVEHFNRLDILINNAGVFNEDDWELTIDVNLKAVIRSTLLGYQYMSKDKGGKGGVIINTASDLGLKVLGVPIYEASKHAVVALCRSFAITHKYNTTGIRNMAICPGITDTPMAARSSKAISVNHIFPINSVKQSPEIVAQGMITTLMHGENGSVWVVKDGQPIYEIEIPDYHEIRKE